MCLLSFYPPEVLPDTAALLHGTLCNDDGHGFAIVAGGHLIVHRSMAAVATVEAFAAARHQHRDGPALFHSRFATHGATGVDNCHPFVVGGDPRTVLAHNGVLPPTVQPARGDPRSDTRILAEDYLPVFGTLRQRRNRLRLARWITPHNKVVLLTTDRRFRQRAYILNEDAGIWDGGVWYSNDTYQPPEPESTWPPDAEAPWRWSRWDPTPGLRYHHRRCLTCNAIVDVTDDPCPCCDWCARCGEAFEECWCSTDTALDRFLAPPATATTCR